MQTTTCFRALVFLAGALAGSSLPAQTSTTVRAATPTMVADQSGCPSINYYDVGPGKSYTALMQLPWSKLKGCDSVRIYPKPNNAPYYEMILVSAGTNLAPSSPTRFMRVIGMPDPVSGDLPIIDGTNATQLETVLGQTRTLQYWENNNPVRALYRYGLVMISGQIGRDMNFGPAGYISIENLDIRNASYPGTFYDGKFYATQPDTTGSYDLFTSCIFAEVAAHLILRNNVIHGCGNGIFINSKNASLVELSQDVLIEGNQIFDNSNAAGLGGGNGRHEHNSYTEARDIIYQNNVFGDVKTGAFGDCLKDRSSGLVVRYNVFASNCGNQMSLLNSTGGQALIWGDPGYSTTYIYGNVFDVSMQSNTSLALYGGDANSTTTYRQGTLYFYNNTLTVKGDNMTTSPYPSVFLFHMDLQNAIADIRNNIFFTTPATAGAEGKIQVMSYGAGTANLANNWVSPSAAQFWLGHPVAGAVVNGWNTNMGANNNPMMQQDLRPASGSPLLDAAAPLAVGVISSGNRPNGVAGLGAGMIRPSDGHLDIGAYEGLPLDTILRNGFE
ncbi:MAG: hypothetical protein ABIW82_07270 [Dokdonella sp.]